MRKFEWIDANYSITPERIKFDPEIDYTLKYYLGFMVLFILVLPWYGRTSRGQWVRLRVEAGILYF